MEKKGCRSWGPRTPKGVDPAGCPWLRPTQHCLGSGWKMSPADPDAASLCPKAQVAVGTYPQSPRGAGEPPKGLEMDSGKRLFKAFLGKMPESQPSQENGQPSAPPSPAVARGPPGAPSSSRQVLQTRDRVS